MTREERIADLGRFYAPLVSDVLDGLGMRGRALPSAILPIDSTVGKPLVGPAFPCQVVRTDEWVEISRLLEMVDEIPAGAVVVVTQNEETGAALWGGLMSTRASARGAVGAVIDGAVRDLGQIRELAFPVFASSRSILDIRGRGEMAGWNVTVDVGGVSIAPGDIVFADENGAIAIPSDSLEKVHRELVRAFEEEQRTARDLRQGRGARSSYDEHGRF